MKRCQSTTTTTNPCQNEGKYSCSGCGTIELPISLRARYCGVDCQTASFQDHKKVHSTFKKNMSDSVSAAADIYPRDMSGYCQTVCLTFMELKVAGILPILHEDSNILTILFAGARDEILIDFKKLFSLLKQFIYPNLKKLNVYLVGPDVVPGRQISNSTEVTISAIQKKIEIAFNVTTITNFHAIFMIAPGFSSFLDSWTPAIQLFTSVNTPVICTAYSNLEKKDNDALFDEDCMIRYYRAKSVVPTTCNPRCEVFPAGPLGHKNRYYFITCGLDDTKPIIERTIFKRELSASYLEFQADFYGWRDQNFAHGCRTLAKRLLDGSFDYRNETMDQLINMARRM